ncbi:MULTISPECIES: SAV_915 family protein [Miniimonas]|uniref:SAV_915 family protein n=1 Tax=Miniimonas TaxID=947525 RepID=UPI001901DD22|nr:MULTISPECIES: SAV_915 family protein [Miniimonas]
MTEPSDAPAARAGGLPFDVPPVFYVPCTRHVTEPDQLEVVYRTTKDGRTALLLYTALDRFQGCNGPDAPWFLAATSWLDELRKVRPYDVVYLDLPLPAHERIGAAR